MKLVYKNPAGNDGPGDMLSKAKQLEKEGDLGRAAAAYEKIIKKNPVNEYAYNRLMIIYRKNKDYKKEKAIIDAAIRAIQQFYSDSLKLSHSSRVKTLSKAILKATGLADKTTGKLFYEREPLYRWNKRRELVIKKIKG
jgi:tetratricopeptide (TPR) repeat protein